MEKSKKNTSEASKSLRVEYKRFIEDNFYIKNKNGEYVPFIFNPTQNYYYDLMVGDYPAFSGIRENILKFRQPGMSSLIDAMFMVDFILGELGEIPVTDSDIVSYREKDTQVLFNRALLFFDSWLAKALNRDFLSERDKIRTERRKMLLKDSSGVIAGRKGSEMYIQTASARVSGRGGTKQNIHWSEVAYYSNTENINAEELVTGAEEQVPSETGKVFRETTGNIADDFFAKEYEAGKDGVSDFKSRFFGWWIHPDYQRTPPEGWKPPEYYAPLIKRHKIPIEQCYWHYRKTNKLQSIRKLREYPSDETEAFLLGGDPYFDKEAILHYSHQVKEPLAKEPYVSSLPSN